MTPPRFRKCLTAPRWFQRGLADVLGVRQGTLLRWVTGEGVIPASVAQWSGDLTVSPWP